MLGLTNLTRLMRLVLALVMTLPLGLTLPAAAWAQGANPRCPDAPLRVPSGNWVDVTYFDSGGGYYWGVGLVNKSKEITPGVYPEQVTPVYAPLSGYLNNVGTAYSFPGSVFITSTLDATWQGKVPTRNIRLWLTHMSNLSGTVSYVIRPSGPINEGDLIGYQGWAPYDTARLHLGVYDSEVPFNADDSTTMAVGVLNPKLYMNAYVDGREVIALGLDADGRDMPIICTQTPMGAIESPSWGSYVKGSTTISGYALDRTNITQTVGINGGVDFVKLLLDGYDPSQGGNGQVLATMPVNLPRPDIQAQFGGQSANSGWQYTWNVAAVPLGRHDLYLYAHQTASNTWRLLDVRSVSVAPFILWLPLLMR